MGNSYSHSRPHGYSYGSHHQHHHRPHYGGSGHGHGQHPSTLQYYPSQQVHVRSNRHGRRHHHRPHHQHGGYGGYGQSYYPSASGVGGSGGMYPGMVPAATPSYGYRGSPYRY